jgi:hypothetical protein
MEDTLIPAPNHLDPIQNTTIGFLEWAEKIVKCKPVAEEFHAWIPIHVGEFLGPMLSGFMDAPVAVYDNKPIEARTVITKDIVGFRDELAKMTTEGKRIFLYMPIWFPGQHIFKKLDPTTFESITCDPPEWMEGSWKIRFAVLDN